MKTKNRLFIFHCLIISLLVLIIYWQVQGFKFVYYDDNSYITEKPWVLKGLTWGGVKWAVTATEAGFWHPLTWLSLMVDSELFRLSTGGYHWTNVILHLISSLLFFLFLRAATGREWPSFLVALLFAVHPLHVESVAWVSQRKDLLSTLFGFGSLLAYIRYARQPGTGRYLTVLILFLFALMAKPMVVTFPLVMLLLDFWPLKRFTERPLKNLIVEKIPFLILSLFASVLVMYTEHKIGALTDLENLSLGMRFANSTVSYAKYVLLTFYPHNLAFFYPYPDSIPLWQVITAALFLLSVTGSVWILRKRYPYLFTGWVWYLITLLPVCGLIQVGPHALADRYSYVTINGLFIMAAWGTAEFSRTPRKTLFFATLWGIILLALSYGSWLQVGYWQNTCTLMERALKVTKNNWIAHTNLGVFHMAEGRYEDAFFHLNKALALKPAYSLIYFNLGLLFNQRGEPERALPYLEKAFAMGFKREDTLLQMGYAYKKMENWPKAKEAFLNIIKDNPASIPGRSALANLLELMGDTNEAGKQWQEVIKRAPENIFARKRLFYIYLTKRDYEEAIKIAEDGVAKKYGDPELYRLLGLAYRTTGDHAKADYYLKLSESPN